MNNFIERGADRLRNQLPDRNPRLFEDPARALAGKFHIEYLRRANHGQYDLPHIVNLSPRVTSTDLRMEVMPRDTVGGTILVYGSWEIPGTKFFLSLLQPGMRVVDIGAHIGYYSLLAGSLVGPDGRVDSFEANDNIRARLQRNVGLNGLEDVVHVHKEAVAEKSGWAEFYPINDIPENTGISSLVRNPNVDSNPVKVPTVSLDEFMAGLPPEAKALDLVKIDVEDAEERVFSGAERFLSAPTGPILFFESRFIDRISLRLEEFGYETRQLSYQRGEGVTFPRLGEYFESPYNHFDAPNFVAIKDGNQISFEQLAARSQKPSLFRPTRPLPSQQVA